MAPVALCFVLLAAPAAAQQAPARSEIVRALSGFEEQPELVTVRGWGPGVIPVLAAVVDDAGEMVAVRARAAYALRGFASRPDARAVLQRVAADESGNLFVRRAAIDALVDGGDELGPVTALLASPDLDLRAGVVTALARARQVALARSALAARAGVEPDPSLRARIAETLRRLPNR